MKFGVVIPYASEREFAGFAQRAEAAGWDMVFSWESVWGQDAWATLAAAAMTTERIRLGTLLTPAARYKPWDLASRVGSVDRLSDGRVTLGVGLGALHGNWLAFEADEGRRVRAERLDECLAIYAGLSAGQPFSYAGRHWSASEVTRAGSPIAGAAAASSSVVRRGVRARSRQAALVGAGGTVGGHLPRRGRRLAGGARLPPRS